MIHLETERLLIRNVRPGDWRALHEMIVQKEASEYAIYDSEWPTAPEAIQKIAVWFAGGDAYLAVCLKEWGTFIGFIALNRAEGAADVAYDLGYCFNARYHGRGFATEGCAAVIDHAFAHLGAARITSGTAAANGPSCRLLGRLGLRVTGEGTASFRHAPDGTPIAFLGRSFALTRAEWDARRSTGR